VFDPERDDDPGNRPYYRRLGVIAALGLLVGIALAPSIMRFDVNHPERYDCVAAVDTWATSDASPRHEACRPASRRRMAVSAFGLATLAMGSALAILTKRSRETAAPEGRRDAFGRVPV
jgi:hypothetical protein